MSAVSLSITDAATFKTTKSYVIGLTVLIAAMWMGLKLYGRLDDIVFRKLLL